MELFFFYSPSASKNKIKDAHKRIMLINHPDRGKDWILEQKKQVIGTNEQVFENYCIEVQYY